MADEPDEHYNDSFIKALQWMWGDGYLAPGGSADVAELLRHVDLSDKNVLDIGSGLGAVAVELVTGFGASHVTGIDVVPHLVEHSRERAQDAGLADRIEFVLVKPGPLSFDDNAFDVVFTKDAIIHIPDKLTFYQDIFRVLVAGGTFVGSDWLRGGEGGYSEAAKRWLDIVRLDFEMKNLEQTRIELTNAGFEDVSLNDRNSWYREEIKAELATLAGEKLDQLAAMIGREAADHRLASSQAKQQVVEEGFLRPTHFIAKKPLSS